MHQVYLYGRLFYFKLNNDYKDGQLTFHYNDNFKSQTWPDGANWFSSGVERIRATIIDLSIRQKGVIGVTPALDYMELNSDDFWAIINDYGFVYDYGLNSWILKNP